MADEQIVGDKIPANCELIEVHVTVTPHALQMASARTNSSASGNVGLLERAGESGTQLQRTVHDALVLTPRLFGFNVSRPDSTIDPPRRSANGCRSSA